MATASIDIQAPFTISGQLEARAHHPEVAGRIAASHDATSWTYKALRDASVRTSHFLLQRLGAIEPDRPGHVAMMMENSLDLLAVFGGCAYGKLLLFGVNPGLRGDVLAGVLNHSRARVLVASEHLIGEVLRVRDQLKYLREEDLYTVPSHGRPAGEVPPVGAVRPLEACIAAEIAPAGASLPAPSVSIAPTDNLMVIYTSGTTGLPKGINNNHAKLLLAGRFTATNLELGPDDCAYISMPLYHSNSMFVGWMPAFMASARIGIRERFSASRFVDDVKMYVATYWNYVGEPVHYVLAAVEARYGGDAERIVAEVANDPAMKLKLALGNGAAPPDIDRMMRYFGLEDIFELYGSTESAISTYRQKGDPRGSVGEVRDPAVKVLREDGSECPPAKLDAAGRISNYDQAVGEICRVAPNTALFQGYFDNEQANREKYKDGTYHSGDLGHIVVVGDKRFLYFDGRTADWIRKDGENFSASQVGRIISEHPDIALAVAYGAPCAVSDELVMAAIKMRAGAAFDPKLFFVWCESQIQLGSMDPKWMPDYVRIVDDFVYTETQKVLVRNLKDAHFDRRRLPDTPIYWRTRGDQSYRPFTAADYAAIREAFAASERLQLLDR